MSYMRWRWPYNEALTHIGPSSRMTGSTFCGLRLLWCFEVTDPDKVPTCFRCLAHPYAVNEVR